MTPGRAAAQGGRVRAQPSSPGSVVRPKRVRRRRLASRDATMQPTDAERGTRAAA